MKQLWVNDLEVGSHIKETFKIVDFSVATAKNKKDFARFKAVDKTGSIDCTMFNYAPHALLSEGSLITLYGLVEEYRGNKQLKVELFSDPLSGISSGDFEIASTYNAEDMWTDFQKFMIFDDEWFTLVTHAMFKESEAEAFKISPAAAGMHHAFKHGLLEHTLQMLTIGKEVLNLPFMAQLNKDLCLFGIMFHDFGKIYEYSQQGSKKTLQGLLVPHIPMVAAKIYEACGYLRVPEVVRDHMMHVVLAHHGCLEYGSPVVFGCPEAAFVHYIDNLHSDVFGMLQKRASAKDASVKYGFGMEAYNVLKEPFSDIMKKCRGVSNEEGRNPTGLSGIKTDMEGF